jgi:RNA polymerase II subunit A C-terminal domain phosphatase
MPLPEWTSMTKTVQGVCQNVYEEFYKQKCMLTQAIFTALLEKQKDNKSSPILADDEQTSKPDEKPEESTEPEASKSVDDNFKEEVTPKPDADTPETLEIIPSKEPDTEKQEAIPNKVEGETKEAEKTNSEVENAVEKKEEPSEEIEIEDPDDYLMYLEEILSKIHSEYYKQYDETGAVPVMRDVIPNIRRKILEGQSIVFSGVVPTHVSVNNSRYAQMARKLGATVAEQVSFLETLPAMATNIFFQIVPGETTHLVAARHGTAKVNEARRAGTGVLVVSPEWLVCCTERWERADERLFPLSKSSKRGF